MSECIHFLLTAQLLFAEASEHHEAGRVVSEYMLVLASLDVEVLDDEK